MQNGLLRVAAWLITLVLVVALAGVIAWTLQSQPTTLALPTPQPLAADRTGAAANATAVPADAVSATAAVTPAEPVAATVAATVAETGAVVGVPLATTVTHTPTPAETATEAPPVTELPALTVPAATLVEEEAATAAPDVSAARTATATATATAVASATATATAIPTALSVPTPTRTPTVISGGQAVATLAAATASAEARDGSNSQNADRIPLALPTEGVAPVAPSGTITTVAIVGLPVPTPTPALPQLAGEWTAFTDPNEMNALVVISNTVWIATEGGALAWTKGSTTPVLFTAEDGLHGNQLTSVADCALPGFGVVFGSPAGLQISDPRTGRWRLLNSASGAGERTGADNGRGMRYDDVATLYCDVENGFLIVGYAEQGIDIYDAEREEWRHLDRNSGLAANDVNALAVAGDRDQIWVASDEGVTVSAGSDSAFFDAANSELLADAVTALTAAPDGTVWLGGDGALYRVDGDEWTVYTAESIDGDFPTGSIVGLVPADDGTLWVGSTAADVCRFDPAAGAGEGRCTEFYRQAATDGMAPAPLTSLAVDGNGAVYYTTKGGGYAVRETRGASGTWRAFAVREPGLLGNSVRALSRDAGGNLWAATNAGVQRFEADSEPVLFDPETIGIAAVDVQVLAAAPEGQMWVGGQVETGGGTGTRTGAAVSLYDGRNWRQLTTEDGLVGSMVQAIAPDADGRVWVGSDAGISVWNGSSFFVINRQQGLPSDDIRALAADGGGVWIGTAGGGLYRFAESQLQLFNRQNVGLPSDTITQLAIGQDGVLWIGTDKGLAQLADGELVPVEELGERTMIGLAVTADGSVWAAAQDNPEQNPGGDVLFFSNGGQGRDQWTALTLTDPLPSQRLTSLLATDADVWIGGESGGIMQFDGESE